MYRLRRFVTAAAPLLLSGAILAAPALAADNSGNQAANPGSPAATTGTGGNAAPNQNDAKQSQSAKQDAQKLVEAALKEVQTMQNDPKLKELMGKAKGIYLVPNFGRGAFVVGGRGGAGVVLAHTNGQWTDPAFYDFGAISLGAQAGGAGGPIAFLLMSQGAVDAFRNTNNFSLNAEGGLSIVTYSTNAQTSWGKGDIILWSNTKGAYAGASVSVSDIVWDGGKNQAYYGKTVQPMDILAGKVGSPDAAQLKNALPG